MKKVIVAFLIIAVIIELVFLLKGSKKTIEAEFAKLGYVVVEKCEKEQFKPKCYDKEIPKLMDFPHFLSMEDAFQVTRTVQKISPEYSYCHVLGHNLSTKETKKNPSKWMDVITRCPQTMCNNGCLHGALMERYKNEHLTDAQIKEVIPDLQTVCEARGSWRPVGVETAMCYHALGHLNMYITNGDVKKSTSLCKDITKKSDPNIPHDLRCMQGTLMSIFQPLEAEDFALVKGKQPKKEQVQSYCDSFTGYARSACFKESWPLFRDEIMTPEGAIKFCSYTTDPQETFSCYNHVLHIVTVVFAIDMNNFSKLHDYCMALPAKGKDYCFGSAADRLLQIDPIVYADKAIGVCSQADEIKLGKTCYKMLIEFATQSFHRKSPKAINFCNKLADKDPWYEHCKKALL